MDGTPRDHPIDRALLPILLAYENPWQRLPSPIYTALLSKQQRTHHTRSPTTFIWPGFLFLGGAESSLIFVNYIPRNTGIPVCRQRPLEPQPGHFFGISHKPLWPAREARMRTRVLDLSGLHSQLWPHSERISNYKLKRAPGIPTIRLRPKGESIACL